MFTDVKESLNLAGQSANRLNFPLLADRAGHSNALKDWHIGNGREQGEQLCTGRTVTLHHAVSLLKAKAGRERQRLVLGKVLSQVTTQDNDALGVDFSTQPGFSINRDDTLFSHGDIGRDPAGFAKCVVTGLQNAQTVNLAHLATIGLDPEDVFLDQFLDTFFNQV